jgi:hypothetical protein
MRLHPRVCAVALQRDDGGVRSGGAEADRAAPGRLRGASGIGAGLLAENVRRHNGEREAELLRSVPGSPTRPRAARPFRPQRGDRRAPGQDRRPPGQETRSMGERHPDSRRSRHQPRRPNAGTLTTQQLS